MPQHFAPLNSQALSAILVLSFCTAIVCSARFGRNSERSKSWCHFPDCMRRAFYRNEQDSVRSCPRHRNSTDVPIRQACGRHGCPRQPSFGLRKGSILYCEAHKEQGHINLRNRMCMAANCQRTPSFASEHSRRPQFCALHRSADHVNVVSPRCSHDGCSKQPRYGQSGSGPVLCAQHKQEEHVDVKSKRCTYAEGCTNAAIYGCTKDRVPLLCLLHKEPSHINCKVRLCEFVEGCARQPSFGHPHDLLPRFCKEHKEKGHVDLKHGCCIYLGCPKQPQFPHQLCAVHKRSCPPNCLAPPLPTELASLPLLTGQNLDLVALAVLPAR